MNAVFALNPSRSKFGIWAFDDAERQLKQEPFVGQTNTLIDLLVKKAGGKIRNGKEICLMFSPFPFDGHQTKIELLDTSESGSFYKSKEFGLTPWLCPALFKYFPAAPSELYAQVIL